MESIEKNPMNTSPLLMTDHEDNGRKGFLRFEDRNIFYVDQGVGCPVVTVHGFPDSHQSLRRLMNSISQNSRVLGYDQTGSGQSAKPDVAYSIPFMVGELAETSNHFGFQKMFLLGHSIGGTISVLFAAKYPERVRGIVLINPALKDFKIHTGMNFVGAWFMQWPIIGSSMLLFHNRWFTKNCLKLAFYDSSRMNDEMVDTYHTPFQSPGAYQSYLKMARSVYRQKDQEILAKIEKVKAFQIPVLLLWTEKDWSMPIDDGRYFAEKLGARFHSIPDCGHSPHLELNDQRFDEHMAVPIRRFIREINHIPVSS